MAELIKTITDKAAFEKIFYKFFMKSSVFLKTKNGDIKIQFFGYTDGLLALRVPFIKNMYDSCIIFTRFDTYTIYASLKFLEKQEDDTYIFAPLKFQIISVMRREDRKIVDLGGEGKRVIYATNIISDFIIQNSLAMEHKKVDHVRESVLYDLEKQFKMVRIYFSHEGAADPRMKFFHERKVPLVIPDIHNREASKDTAVYNIYLNEIYTRDYPLVNKKDLISEISVPVLYKAKIPYGYVQANHTSVLADSALASIKRTAIMVEEMFNKQRIFPMSGEKLLVSDVSKRGLGIVFKERRFIRYFKENSSVYLDIMLPDNKKASCLAAVKNIGILENKIIKIGCEIRELDALGEVNYEEFLSTLGGGM